jgi:hypothetical protein
MHHHRSVGIREKKVALEKGIAMTDGNMLTLPFY